MGETGTGTGTVPLDILDEAVCFSPGSVLACGTSANNDANADADVVDDNARGSGSGSAAAAASAASEKL